MRRFDPPIIRHADSGIRVGFAKLLQQAFDGIAQVLSNIRHVEAETIASVDAAAGEIVAISTTVTSGIRKLATVDGISLVATGGTILYTAGDGRYVVTDVVLRATSADTVTVAPEVSVGVSASGTEIFARRALRGAWSTAKAWAFGAAGIREVLDIGDSAYLVVHVGATATALVASADIFGYEVQ